MRDGTSGGAWNYATVINLAVWLSDEALIEFSENESSKEALPNSVV